MTNPRSNHLALRYPTLYLCGPMTGMPNFNRPLFAETADTLRAAGYTVLNPGENKRPEHEPWQAFMRDAIALLIQADAIATLPGWQYSEGAKIETDLARRLAIPVREAETWYQEANVATIRRQTQERR